MAQPSSKKVHLTLRLIAMHVCLLGLFLLTYGVGGILYTHGGYISVLGVFLWIIAWIAIMLQMLIGVKRWWVVLAAGMVFLINMIIFSYGLQSALLRSFGKQTDARIVRLSTVQAYNPKGAVGFDQVYASLNTASGRPIHGRLLVSGDNYAVGDHVSVFYDPSGWIGPQQDIASNKPNGYYVVSGVLFAVCLWPMTVSVVQSVKTKNGLPQ